DAGLRAAGVIEQNTVADFHVVAHEVARLEIAHAGPRGFLAGRREDVSDRALVRLGFHQPVLHRVRASTFHSKNAASPVQATKRFTLAMQGEPGCCFCYGRCPPPCRWALFPNPGVHQGGRLPVTSGSSDGGTITTVTL